jgi:hypothetical protein
MAVGLLSRAGELRSTIADQERLVTPDRPLQDGRDRHNERQSALSHHDVESGDIEVQLGDRS